MTTFKLGIIGGSGVYQMEGANVRQKHLIRTPFGPPSEAVMEIEFEGNPRTAYFIPRHGIGHKYTPTEVPYRGNIHALKSLGVTHVLAISAVGIMRDNIKPGDLVVPDQIFDRTKGIRQSTFFGAGCVGHIGFADPFCKEMREIILNAAKLNPDITVHHGGTYVCMEGPQFSTRAESNFYRQTLQPAVIGMTAIPEAKLAREAEMCYGMLALATDYDCWHEDEEDVSVEAVLSVLKANSQNANKVIREIAKNLPKTGDCDCFSAAKNAIMTKPELLRDESRRRLETLYGKYFK